MLNVLNTIESLIHKTSVKDRSTSGIPYKNEWLLKKTIKTGQIDSVMNRPNKKPINMEITLWQENKQSLTWIEEDDGRSEIFLLYSNFWSWSFVFGIIFHCLHITRISLTYSYKHDSFCRQSEGNSSLSTKNNGRVTTDRRPNSEGDNSDK